MHLRMFELARDALNSEGYYVIGGYMSPVNDACKKKGLISTEHRLRLCNLAYKSLDFVMVDPWEANQSTYQCTLTVLSRVRNSIYETGLVSKGDVGDVLRELIVGDNLRPKEASNGDGVTESDGKDKEEGRGLVVRR
ncbi:hypothetical protein RJT34_17294 [Clitoria ternatea]|uniref:Cytidyltransferase-like domain-containing protein n=1 Tax=Clitoria ternatea TaxID=43366 RepID=A0AAN9J8R5_CLITE